MLRALHLRKTATATKRGIAVAFEANPLFQILDPTVEALVGRMGLLDVFFCIVDVEDDWRIVAFQ